MSRVIQDPGFHHWEAFANPGPSGFPRPGRIVFRCQSDPSLRPRVVEIDGNKSEAELALTQLTDGELQDLLRRASEVQ